MKQSYQHVLSYALRTIIVAVLLFGGAAAFADKGNKQTGPSGPGYKTQTSPLAAFINKGGKQQSPSDPYYTIPAPSELEYLSPRLHPGDTEPPGWRSGFGNKEGDERGHRIPTAPPIPRPDSSPGAVTSAGIVSLTFDDGSESQYQDVLPVLQSANQSATFYLNSAFLGSPGYMTWPQVQQLEARGFEVAGHTAHHIELPTVSLSEMVAEIVGDFNAFVAHGITPTDFATPFGAYDNNTIATIAKTYNSHRAFANQGLNFWPYNKYLLYVHYVTNTTTLAQADAWVDEAAAKNGWLVLVFHEILPVVDPADDYSWQTDNFLGLLSYIKTKRIPVKTVEQALAPRPNLLANSSFESGFSGWTTDSPANVTVDAGNNGSYPTPVHAVQIAGAAGSVHLFGQKVPVSFGTTYGLRAYVDGRNFGSGETGFFIDEYDKTGNWISGKWLGALYSPNTVDYAYLYTPTSSAVAAAAVQVYAAAGTTGSVYMDNFELIKR